MAHHQKTCTCEPDPEKDPRVREQPISSEPPSLTPKDPRGSDFFPSVSLAALLGIVFVLVVSVMFSESGGASPLGRVRGRLVHLHPLFTSQTSATRWALENSLQPNRDGGVTVIAVSDNHAAQTLRCFSRNLISSLSHPSQAHNVTQRLREYKPNMSSWIRRTARSTRAFYVTVVDQRKGQAPFGVILGPEDNLVEGRHLWEMTLTVPNVENVENQDNGASGLAKEVLNLLYTTGRIPETFDRGRFGEEHLPVIHILGDPYLESGFVC
ncbi:uncharacterized protein RCH25_004776 [Pelodytes ibericus]